MSNFDKSLIKQTNTFDTHRIEIIHDSFEKVARSLVETIFRAQEVVAAVTINGALITTANITQHMVSLICVTNNYGKYTPGYG